MHSNSGIKGLNEARKVKHSIHALCSHLSSICQPLQAGETIAYFQKSLHVTPSQLFVVAG